MNIEPDKSNYFRRIMSDDTSYITQNYHMRNIIIRIVVEQIKRPF